MPAEIWARDRRSPGKLRFLLICVVLGPRAEQIRAVFPGPLKSTGLFPFLDLGVVPRKENVGDLETSETGRLGVGRGFEEVWVGERFILRRALITKCPGKEANDGVADDGAGQGAIGQNIVSDADFLVDQLVDHAVIDTLVVTAEKEKVRTGGQASCFGLHERLALGSGEKDACGLLPEVLNRSEQRFGLEQHPRATPAEVVVSLSVLSPGPRAEIVGMNLDDPGGLGPFEDALIQGREGDFGEKGDNINAHEGEECPMRPKFGKERNCQRTFDVGEA